MNGPEHYKEAEDALDKASNCLAAGLMGADTYYHLGRAQVHATLALAAATALGVIDDLDYGPDSPAWKWDEAIS